MISVAHFYNEIINHYDISTQEKLGGGKLRQQPQTMPTSDVFPIWYKHNVSKKKDVSNVVYSGHALSYT